MMYWIKKLKHRFGRHSWEVFHNFWRRCEVCDLVQNMHATPEGYEWRDWPKDKYHHAYPHGDHYWSGYRCPNCGPRLRCEIYDGMPECIDCKELVEKIEDEQ
jgi:hypothetical protein